MQNSLVCITNLQPIGVSQSTGLQVYQNFSAASGFNYMVGMRSLEGLKIIEGVAEGTACIFLTGIKILDSDNKLIAEIEVEYGTHYTREKVVDLVADKLFHVIWSSMSSLVQSTIDSKEVKSQIVKLLDDCYLGESKKCALEWAKKVGIIK